MPQHRKRRVQRVVCVVEERHVNHAPAVIFQQDVQRDLLDGAASFRGNGGDAVIGQRLIVERRVHGEHLVEGGQDAACKRVGRRPALRHQLRPEGGIPQPLDPRRQREIRDLAIARTLNERMRGQLKAEKKSDRPPAHLRLDRQSLAGRRLKVRQQRAPAVRRARRLQK